jgi:serine/threonine-protein kinase ATR
LHHIIHRRALAELVNLHARAADRGCRPNEAIFMKINVLLDSSVKDAVKETLLVTIGSIGW